MDCRASNWKALSICKVTKILVTKNPYKEYKVDKTPNKEYMTRHQFSFYRTMLT